MKTKTKYNRVKDFEPKNTSNGVGALPAPMPALCCQIFILYYLKKSIDMLQTVDLENAIYHTLHLAKPSDNEGVVFGSIEVWDNPNLVGIVMDYTTRFYDVILSNCNLDPADMLSLQVQRCFTETEYRMLFDFRERDFTKAIFKTLLIVNHTDRLLFTTNRDTSHASYLKLLKDWSEVHNSVLYSFIYETISTAS